MASSPALDGQARQAVVSRGGNVQIIASAGSGKTEVVAQRVTSLLADGTAPEAIIAFTFTEKAAASLAARIQERVSQSLGVAALGKLSPLYVGTIHAYCFHLLQRHVARYETYEVLDERRLAAFLAREGGRIGIKQLDQRGRLFAAIQTFLVNAEVVENELLAVEDLREPFRSVYTSYVERLDAYRALTFGRLISEAVLQLEDPDVRAAVRAPLRHVIVDEYQDVNPAQEQLIQLLSGDPVELCVVGDDDQAIYQWRGTDVGNIVSFADRYALTRTFALQINRRSRPAVVRLANRCSALIQERLPKTMKPCREDAEHAVVFWRATDESEQAHAIAAAIARAHAQGYRYSDVAVLLRGRTSLPAVLDAFEEADIPVLPGGRTSLFLQQDARTFGRLCAWLAGHEWRETGYGRGAAVTLASLMRSLTSEFGLDASARRRVKDRLQSWHREVREPTGPASLVRDFYELLALLGVDEWDHDDPAVITRLGALARCSEILADFESMRYRARVDREHPGEVVGGQDRGEWHYRWLAIYVQNYALGAYEEFDGEDVVPLDAVEVTTIHKAKGLEWPVVFIPSVIDRRFPSANVGKPRAEWHVPTELFDQSRYNGSLNDERRLFYVALTRAREQVLVSSFDSYARSATRPSPLLEEVIAQAQLVSPASVPLPPPPDRAMDSTEMIEVALSDLLLYDACGMSFRLRSLLGFQPVLARELGYGKAVHHILRLVAEHVQRHGRPPDQQELAGMFDRDFYLPLATKPMHRQLKRQARELVSRFIESHADELRMLWAVERPFELRTESALVSGRADVILGDATDGSTRLTIVDYKTNARRDAERADRSQFEFQLRVYGDAGAQEGLDVAGAYVHDLAANERVPVSVNRTALTEARTKLDGLIESMRDSRYEPRPGSACTSCDVSPICRHRLDG